MSNKLEQALKAAPVLDDEDSEVASAPRVLYLARDFFWKGSKLPAGLSTAPSGLTVEMLPTGGKIDGEINPKLKVK